MEPPMPKRRKPLSVACELSHLLVQAIRNGRSGGLIDDAHDLKASNHTSILQEAAGKHEIDRGKLLSKSAIRVSGAHCTKVN